MTTEQEQSAALVVTVQPVEYRVSCLTDTVPDWEMWEIKVELRSHGRWSVRHLTKSLGVDGLWSFGPRDDEDATAWVQAHRFALDEALRLAREHTPMVKVNGVTAAQFLLREEVRRA